MLHQLNMDKLNMLISMLLNPQFIEIQYNFKETKISLLFNWSSLKVALYGTGDRAYLPVTYGQLLAHLQWWRGYAAAAAHPQHHRHSGLSQLWPVAAHVHSLKWHNSVRLQESPTPVLKTCSPFHRNPGVRNRGKSHNQCCTTKTRRQHLPPLTI